MEFWKEQFPPGSYQIKKGDHRFGMNDALGVYLCNDEAKVGYKSLSAEGCDEQNFLFDLSYNNSDGSISLRSLGNEKFLNSQTFTFTGTSSNESKFEFYGIQIKGGVMVRSVPDLKSLSDEELYFEKPIKITTAP